MLILITTIFSISRLTYGFKFLENLDFKLLDEKEYCQLKVNINEFDLTEFENFNIYVSGHNSMCKPCLILTELEKLSVKLCSSTSENSLIKDTNVTYIFWNKQSIDLNQWLTKYVFNSFQCTLPKCLTNHTFFFS